MLIFLTHVQDIGVNFGFLMFFLARGKYESK